MNNRIILLHFTFLFLLPLYFPACSSASGGGDDPSNLADAADNTDLVVIPDGIDAIADADTGPDNVESCLAAVEGEPTQLADHQVQRATSTDGFSFTLEDEVLLEAASVPDAVVRDDGETWVYYVNGQLGQHSVFIASRTDDSGLEEFDCIRIDNAIEPNAVDPDIVQLDDGRYRLFYFLGWFVGEPPPSPDTPHPFYSAISDDGIHFEEEGLLFEVEGGGTDPTGVQLEDGSWLVAIAHEDGTMFFSSEDGSDYQDMGVSVPSGIPELAVLADGTLRLYNAERDGWKMYDSPDGGETWDEVGSLLLPGADPSLVHEADGTYSMYFKSFAADGPGPNNGPDIQWASEFEPPTGAAHADVERGAGARRLLSATSSDGLTFERNGAVISDQANVPDMVRVGETIFLYYTGETVGEETNVTAVALSRDDGDSWIYKYLHISGWDGMVSDPDIIYQQGEGFTLFFTSTGGIHRATGTDGLRFVYDDVVLSYDDGPTWDSSSHFLPMGVVMYTLGASDSPGLHYIANSTDGGESFEAIGDATLSHEGRNVFAPNGLIVDDVGVRMYAFSPGRDGGIVSLVTGNGETFLYDDGYRLQPSGDLEGDNLRGSAVVQLEDGSYFMVYTADIPQ